MTVEERFLTFIKANRGILYKIANSYSRNDADRNDLVQEMLAQLWSSFDRYDPQFKFSTWMYRVTLNVAISTYRKDANRRKRFTEYDDQTLNVASDHEPNELERQVSLLNLFLSELNELDRALMLLYLEEVPQKEIAAILGISESNVSTKIGRTKEKLRQRFSKLEQPNDG
ncbi:MAG: sigma-70 family RNA polymerase sigma factor [Bacteroidetes bacterium]|nr:sigma-70 family RNA polymerase sigma factor [Bacteroidota bacterium]